ncbi:hypothetical protein BDV27DRAFT_165798 [Aspergillus caelatus]|uniref:Uncharacterized protein n=1 Tax=Aspergillus caelatus TaxID=61420 RepID=A0A5N6ZZ32_9EURO|nr:uncharacterized protein BDV27DRAFT_165798 [Aspergillus caelatus]KAE8362864.1 hypothetical protein BDV27DRAFT_165798 [Aspergillus caelatus]
MMTLLKMKGKERARPPLTCTFSILVAWKKSSQVAFPQSQQCGLIEGRFVIDLQGGRRIYTGLSCWYFLLFPLQWIVFWDCSVRVFSQEVGEGLLLLNLVILQNFAFVNRKLHAPVQSSTVVIGSHVTNSASSVGADSFRTRS